MANPSVERSSEPNTEHLLRLMHQRRELLEILLKLASAQSEAAKDADVDLTLGVLARKEQVLEKISRLGEQLADYRDDDPEQREWESAARRAECRKAASDGDALLARIVELEGETLQAMSFRRDAVAAQLQQGKDSQLAHHAYRAGEALEQSSLDISSF